MLDLSNYRSAIQQERAEAMARGGVLYDSPRACGVCGYSQRYVKTGKCAHCQRARVSKAPARRGNRTSFTFKISAYIHPSDAPTVRAFIEGINAQRATLLPPTPRQQRLEASRQARLP